MLMEVAAYLVLAPVAGALLAVLAWVGWTHRRRGLAAVAVKKDSSLSD